jgi:hypothetical protein
MRPFQRPRCRWENKMDNGETELNWYKRGPNDGTFKEMVMNSIRARNFLTS